VATATPENRGVIGDMGFRSVRAFSETCRRLIRSQLEDTLTSTDAESRTNDIIFLYFDALLANKPGSPVALHHDRDQCLCRVNVCVAPRKALILCRNVCHRLDKTDTEARPSENIHCNGSSPAANEPLVPGVLATERL
jgi:hypothetical protein